MTLVRIVKPWAQPDLMRQSPGGAGVWGGCRFTLDPVGRCDYLVVLNHAPAPIEVEVSRDRVWCVVQEPPDPVFRWIEKGFPRFRRVVTQNARLRGAKFSLSHGSLPWHVNRTYDELAAMPPPAKSRPLSWITSSAAFLDGHRRRLRFLGKLRASEVAFDLFGRGFAPLADKWDGLAPYRYAIAVENASFPHYWTEKIADCFLAWTMPIYYGAANIAEYFPSESFAWIDIDDPAAPRRIAEIARSNLAERNRDAIAEARRRVLEEYQFFPRMARMVADQHAPRHASPPEKILLPFVPDLSGYYIEHGPLSRLARGVVRRVRQRLGIAR